MKVTLLFALACILGLFLQGTIHSLDPYAIAPDIIAVLIISLALCYQNVFGLLLSFLLGLASDFASAQAIGPSSAGGIVAFGLVVLISQKVYAERKLALAILTLVSSLAKSVVSHLMLAMYTGQNLFGISVLQKLFLEAFLTALIAPVIIQFFQRQFGGVTKR